MLYVVSGSDNFRKEEEVKRILTVYEAQAEWYEEKNFREAVASSLSLSLWGAFPSGTRFRERAAVWQGKAVKAQDEELLKENVGRLANPLLLVVDSIDGRTKLGKWLKNQAKCANFDLLLPWKRDRILKEVKERANALNLALAEEVENYLVEAVGNDLRRMQGELEVLAAYQGDKPLGSLNCLDKVREIVPNLNQSSLELAKAMKEGKAADCLELTQSLLDQGVHSLEILAIVLKRLVLWTKMSACFEAEITEKEAIAKLLEVKNPQQVFFLSQEVTGTSRQSLSRLLRETFDLQYQVKRGLSPKDIPLSIALFV